MYTETKLLILVPTRLRYLAGKSNLHSHTAMILFPPSASDIATMQLSLANSFKAKVGGRVTENKKTRKRLRWDLCTLK